MLKTEPFTGIIIIITEGKKSSHAFDSCLERKRAQQGAWEKLKGLLKAAWSAVLHLGACRDLDSALPQCNYFPGLLPLPALAPPTALYTCAYTHAYPEFYAVFSCRGSITVAKDGSAQEDVLKDTWPVCPSSTQPQQGAVRAA